MHASVWDYIIEFVYKYKSVVFFVISFPISCVSLATPITTMQTDLLQAEINEAGSFSESVFEEVSIKSETIDIEEIFNIATNITREPTSAKAITEVSEVNQNDDSDINYKPESDQVIDLKLPQNKNVPLGDLTDFELDSGLFFLLEPLVDDPEFKESAREILTTIKFVKEALFDDELVDEHSESIFTDNADNTEYKRRRHNALNNSTNAQYSPKKGTYDRSVIKEFIDKFKVFAIFLVVVIILIKLVFVLISSREKANRG